MSKIIEFTWGGTTVEPKDFIKRFSDKLPKLTKVVEGYTDECEEHSYSTGDVYWITHIKKTCKIIFSRHTGQHLSMPADYKLRFHLVDEDGEVGEAQSLAYLAARLESGDVIVPANDGAVDFRVGAAHELIKKKLGQLTYVAQYDERALVGNLVQSANHLVRECDVIPAYINIPLVSADGLVGGTEEDFHMALLGLKSVSQKFNNDRVNIHTEIMLYEGDIRALKEQDYDYIKPSNYMKCNQNQTSKPHDIGAESASGSEDSDEAGMTKSSIYLTKKPPYVPTRIRTNSVDNTKRKLPALPPKWNRSHSVPVVLDPHGEEESSNLYTDMTVPSNEATASKNATMKKSGSFKFEGFLKHIKKTLPKVAVVRPWVKSVQEADDGYCAVEATAGLPVAPVLKPKKKRKGGEKKKGKDKQKQGYNKELPPLPDSAEEEGDYEDTEVELQTRTIMPRYSSQRVPMAKRRTPVPTPGDSYNSMGRHSTYHLTVPQEYLTERALSTETPHTSTLTPTSVSNETYLMMDGHSTRQTKPPSPLPKPTATPTTDNSSVKAKAKLFSDLYSNAEPKVPRKPILLASPTMEEQEESDIMDLTEVPDDLSGLSISDISQCLRLLKLGQYVDSFKVKQVDGNLMRVFTRKTLMNDYKMTKDDSTRILNFVKECWRPSDL